MNKSTKKGQTPCSQCPLRKLETIRAFTPDELRFVERFKAGEMQIEKGATVILEGTNSAHLYTVLSGWAFRYKTTDDGYRQILNFALPGDFLALQGAIFDEMQHSIEALTPLRLCVFDRQRLFDMYREHPPLAYDVTWLAAREEQMQDDHIVNIGKRSAFERIGYLFLHLFDRARHLGLTNGDSGEMSFTQQHLADALGLSLAHTNKTLKKILEGGYVSWSDGKIAIKKREELEMRCNYVDNTKHPRPII